MAFMALAVATTPCAPPRCAIQKRPGRSDKPTKRTTSPGSHPPKRVRGPRVRAGGPSTGQAGSPCRRGRGTARCLRPNLPDLDSACLATPAEVVNNEDTLAVELAVFLSLDTELLPRAQDAAPGIGHPGQPDPTAGRGPIELHVLDIGVRPVGRAVVPALPGRVDPAHQLQVRRRHEPTIPLSRSAGEQSAANPWFRERAPSLGELLSFVLCERPARVTRHASFDAETGVRRLAPRTIGTGPQHASGGRRRRRQQLGERTSAPDDRGG